MVGLYFVSFGTVYWIDVFTRDVYCFALVESLIFYRENKGMERWKLTLFDMALVRATSSHQRGMNVVLIVLDFKTMPSQR